MKIAYSSKPTDLSIEKRKGLLTLPKTHQKESDTLYGRMSRHLPAQQPNGMSPKMPVYYTS